MTESKDLRQAVTHDLLLELVPDIEDSKAAAIMASGASLSDIEEAISWASGQSGVMGDLRRQLNARVATVYDILTADRELEENERA